MDVDVLRTFFGWCTVINGGILILSALILAFGGDWVYRMQRTWFPMPREVFNPLIYGFLGLYKIVVISFNLVPYLALAIMG